jgi:predicted SAM-dependent methyltransferase
LAVRLLRRISSHDTRQKGKVHATTLLLPLSRRKARSLQDRQTGLKLHLASGAHKLPGWVNIDIVGMHPDLYWNLRRGIPFPDGSAEAVFLEHFLEHLTYSDVLDILDECRRVLAPGGKIRVGVPDFGRYMRSYAGDGSFIDEVRPGRPTPLLAVAEVALAHGHRSVWDAATLEQILTEAGFAGARACKFGESELDPPPDNPLREPESIYAEAEKPTA